MGDFLISIYQKLRAITALGCVELCLVPIGVWGAGVEFGEIQTGGTPDYNLKIGEAYFDSTIRSGVGWDSNYDQDPDADGSAFYSVGLLTDLSWIPSPRISLKTNFDLQYIERPEDTGGGQFLISGGIDNTAASMAVAIRSGDRVVHVNTKLSSSLAGLRVEDAEGQQQDGSFQQLVYSIGASYERALSPTLTSSLGYTYSSQQAIGHQADDELASPLNANSHNVASKLALDVNQSLRAGLYAGTTLTDRGNDPQRQVQTYRVGLEGTYISSYAVVFGLSVGADYQANSSELTHSGSGWSPEIQLSANFLKRSILEHKFTATYRRDFANVVTDSGGNRSDLAQFSQTISIGHELGLDLTPTWQVSARQGLRQVDDVGASGGSRRYYLNFKTGYVIAPRWTLNFSYDYTNQFDGGAKGAGFSRHVVSSSLSFKL